MRSVRDAAANIRKTGGFVQCLAIAAYSLNAMKGRVGAGRTRARYATRFLQPSLLRARPENPESCFALRLSQAPETGVAALCGQLEEFVEYWHPRLMMR